MFQNILEERQDIKKIALQAAIKLFIQHGYHGTSLQNIADEGQISKAMTHYYFRGKLGLLVYALKKLNKYIENQLLKLNKKTDDPKERLSKLVTIVEDFFVNHFEAKIIPFLSTELASEKPQLNKLFQQHIESWETIIYTILALFYSEEVAKLMAKDSITYLYGSLIMQEVTKDGRCVESTCKRLAKLWWSGVKS